MVSTPQNDVLINFSDTANVVHTKIFKKSCFRSLYLYYFVPSSSGDRLLELDWINTLFVAYKSNKPFFQNDRIAKDLHTTMKTFNFSLLVIFFPKLNFLSSSIIL